MKAPQLVVMAAGIGRRYGGLKQIDPVGPSGELVIDYSIYDALQAGFRKVVFVIRPEIEEDFREKIGDTIEKHVAVAYAYQRLEDVPEWFAVPAGREKPWGTGHAVLSARDLVDGPFGVINADDFYGRESFRVLARFLETAEDGPEGYAYCMIGFKLGNTLSEHGHVARGVCEETPDGFLARIVERTKIVKGETCARYTEDGERWHDIPFDVTVSMNTWGFTPSIFRELEERFERFLKARGQDLSAEFFLPTVVDELIREGKARVKVCPTPEKWFGVTYREDKPHAEREVRRLVAEGVYPRTLWGDE